MPAAVLLPASRRWSRTAVARVAPCVSVNGTLSSPWPSPGPPAAAPLALCALHDSTRASSTLPTGPSSWGVYTHTREIQCMRRIHLQWPRTGDTHTVHRYAPSRNYRSSAATCSPAAARAGDSRVSVETVKDAPAAAYLRDELGFSDNAVYLTARKWPTVMLLEASEIEAVVNYLTRPSRSTGRARPASADGEGGDPGPGAGVRRKDIPSAVRRFPQMLGLSVDDDLRPVVEYLRSPGGLGLVPDGVGDVGDGTAEEDRPQQSVDADSSITPPPADTAGRVIAGWPEVLGQSVDQLRARSALLRDVVGVRDVADLVRRHPPLLGGPDARALRDLVEYCKHIGAPAGELAQAFPMFLTYDVDRDVRPTVEWLASLGVTDPGAPRCHGLFAWPNVAARLKPAADFLMSADGGGYSAQELMSDPMLLAYSFENRIRPRARFAASLGRLERTGVLPEDRAASARQGASKSAGDSLVGSEDSESKAGLPLASLPLAALTSADDKGFCEAVGVSPGDYRAFLLADGGKR